MDAKTQILLATTELLTAQETTMLLQFPPNDPEYGSWADRVKFDVLVNAVVGNPTAWSLGVKPQYLLPSTGGQQYEQPRWFDYSARDLVNRTLEGEGFYTALHAPPAAGAAGIVADQSDTLPIAASGTLVDFGRSCRIVLSPTFSGQTATLAANTTNGSPNLASVSDFTNIAAGTPVAGAGIPAGAFIKSTNSTAGTAVLSANATATASGVTLTPTPGLRVAVLATPYKAKS